LATVWKFGLCKVERQGLAKTWDGFGQPSSSRGYFPQAELEKLIKSLNDDKTGQWHSGAVAIASHLNEEVLQLISVEKVWTVCHRLILGGLAQKGREPLLRPYSRWLHLLAG